MGQVFRKQILFWHMFLISPVKVNRHLGEDSDIIVL